MTPRPIAAILESRLFLLIARIVVVFAFLVPGIMQILNFNQTLGEFAFFNLNPPVAFVVLSIVTLLIGSVLVIIGGKWTWLGAGALGVYCGLTIFIVHHWWTQTGAEALNTMRVAFEHISIIGGLMCVAAMEHFRTKT